MENELYGIGRVSALSGLPVSALRFYDGAGVLTPSMVDPSSGYRYYEAGQVARARLVAHLRRVSLPLSEIRAVLADPAQAGPVLAAHLARLEAGLADARREISIVHQLLDTTETAMHRCTLPAAALVRALREVRYAVGEDPEQPRLHGVHLDGEADRLRVVATDRYRLATSEVPTAEGAGLHLLLPTTAVDELLAADPTGDLDVVVTDGTITLTGTDVTVRAEVPDVDYPSYRALLEHGRRQVPVDVPALRARLEGDPDEVSLLSVGTDDVRVGESGHPGDVVVAVNRRFLLEALAVGDQLTLGLDDPISPLAVRDPGREGVMSVLMPVRQDQPA
ncbi:MerR family transcriptional regulator [Phycicoccus avicenniae]|uniref:DNA polymerase III subunit beta family protein n=1 Tax=Phycicoccus avicenniae TaxID=2828860 RepID=UPI003D2C473A